MIAVSLNVGGGVRFIKPAKLYICTQKHYKHNKDGLMVPGVCGNGSVPLSHSGNVVTRIGIHTPFNFCIFIQWPASNKLLIMFLFVFDPY